MKLACMQTQQSSLREEQGRERGYVSANVRLVILSCLASLEACARSVWESTSWRSTGMDRWVVSYVTIRRLVWCHHVSQSI